MRVQADKITFRCRNITPHILPHWTLCRTKLWPPGQASAISLLETTTYTQEQQPVETGVIS